MDKIIHSNSNLICSAILCLYHGSFVDQLNAISLALPLEVIHYICFFLHRLTITQGIFLGSVKANLLYPNSVDVNIKNGKIVVCDRDQNQIHIFDSCGNSLFVTDGSLLKKPRGLSINRNNGDIVVCDCENNMIKVFDESGTFIFQIGSRGHSPGQFHYPCGVVVDDNGDIYVCDYSNTRIQVFDQKGNFLKIFLSSTSDTHINNPCGICLDRTLGYFYVCEYLKSVVNVFKRDGEFVRSIGKEAKMSCPRNAVVDLNGNVIVCDFSNNRLVKFDMKGNLLLKHFGEPGTFHSPTSVAIDAVGNLLICDSASGRVQYYS